MYLTTRKYPSESKSIYENTIKPCNSNLSFNFLKPSLTFNFE